MKKWTLLLLFLLILSCSSKAPLHFINPEKLTKSPAYSHIAAIEPHTKMYLISGQVPQDETGKIIGKGDITAQTKQVYANLEKTLQEIGATFQDVAAFKIYITDASKINEFRTIRNELFDTLYFKNQKERPVSTAMAVTALFHPDWLIEIKLQWF